MQSGFHDCGALDSQQCLNKASGLLCSLYLKCEVKQATSASYFDSGKLRFQVINFCTANKRSNRDYSSQKTSTTHRWKSDTANPTFYCINISFFSFPWRLTLPACSFFLVFFLLKLWQKCKFSAFVSKSEKKNKKNLIRIRSKNVHQQQKPKETIGADGSAEREEWKMKPEGKLNKYQPALAPWVPLTPIAFFPRHYELLGAPLIDWFSSHRRRLFYFFYLINFWLAEMIRRPEIWCLHRNCHLRLHDRDGDESLLVDCKCVRLSIETFKFSWIYIFHK